MMMRLLARKSVNRMLGPLNARMVNAHWGPRGFLDAFLRLRGQGMAPKQIVDVGASDGSWTQDCLKVFPESRYFLVDPLTENVAHLKKLSSKNHQITAWHGALGESPGELPMFVHGDQSSFLASEYRGETLESQLKVKVQPLDSFLGTSLLQPPQLLKADVQGFEIAVLQGASKCLETVEALLLEVSYRQLYHGGPLAHEVIAYVGSRGFRIYDICSYTQRAHDSELAQSDMLFVKAGSSIFSYEKWQ
jgi:FkbM family methyltransferase